MTGHATNMLSATWHVYSFYTDATKTSSPTNYQSKSFWIDDRVNNSGHKPGPTNARFGLHHDKNEDTIEGLQLLTCYQP